MLETIVEHKCNFAMKGKSPLLTDPYIKNSQKQKMVEGGPDKGQSISPTRTLLAMVLVSAGMVMTQTAVCFFSFFPKFSFGFFNNGVVRVYNIFRIGVTPSELFFSLIPLAQAGQVGIIGYTLMSLCRQTIQGPRLSNPPVLDTMFFILWNVATALNIVWNFLFDKVFLPESAVLQALVISTLTPAFSIASARLAHYQPQLETQKRLFDEISLRSGVLNVLAMEITQGVISLLIDVTIMASAAFSRPAMQELISSASLGVMTVLTLVYTGLDMTVIEPYTRSVFTPYITMLMSVASMMKGGWNMTGPSSTIKLALIASTITGLVTKLFVSIYNRNKPFTFSYSRLFSACRRRHNV